MIKAFLFDYGGVMTTGGRGNDLSDRLAVNLHISSDAAWELQKTAWAAFMKGNITEPEFWQQVESRRGKSIDVTLRNIWNDWDRMKTIPAMVVLVEELKSQGYSVGLVSNTIDYTAGEIRSHGGYSAFDFLVLSYEEHCSKPEMAIYRLAMSHLPNIGPDEVVFLDDQERCLVPARELGMHTILVAEASQAIHDVHALLASNGQTGLINRAAPKAG